MVTSRRCHRVASIVAALAVFWLWTVANATHVHADHGDHHDCPVCHVIHSPGGAAIVPSAVALPVPAPRLPDLPVPGAPALSAAPGETASLRGPPRSSLA